MKKLCSLALAVLMLFSAILPAAANSVQAPDSWRENWAERSSEHGKIIITPGENEACKSFRWISEGWDCGFEYQKAGEAARSAVIERSLCPYGILNTVELNSLEAGEYSYSYCSDSQEYGPYSFTVEAEAELFSVMFCNDIQLGRSGDNSEDAVINDTFGWERTVNSAVKSDISFILSAGDQVNDGFSRQQYSALLSPTAVKSLPIAAVPGNHDFYSPLYSCYFGNTGEDSIGNDCWFTYGGALFIMLDSNNLSALTHTAAIKQAVSACPDARWRIAVMHNSLYGPFNSENTEEVARSQPLTKAFDKYDIDLVLSGHDHSYARTLPLKNGAAAADGTVYLEGASASGSNYSYKENNSSRFAKTCDLQEPSYSVLNFSGGTLEIKSIRTDSGEVFDSFTLSAEENKFQPAKGLLELLRDLFRRLTELFSAVC